MRQVLPEASRTVQLPTIAVRLEGAAGAGAAAGGNPAISAPGAGASSDPRGSGAPASGGSGCPSMGASGADSTGPDGTASIGAGDAGAAEALRMDGPPKRVEEHALRASVEQSVAVTIQKVLFIVVLLLLGRQTHEVSAARSGGAGRAPKESGGPKLWEPYRQKKAHEAPFRRSVAKKRHTARATIIFFTSAMAFAGLRPLGQVLAQFMIVWQR